MAGWRRGLCGVLTALLLIACTPRRSGQPASGPEARNGVVPANKRRKVKPAPVLAPPPRYGNKIVQRAAEAPAPSTPSDG
jgi:hypothetical protein